MANVYTLNLSQLQLERLSSAHRSSWGLRCFDGGTAKPAASPALRIYPSAQVGQCAEMFMATSFVFLSVTAAFQRPGTAEIKPRQGPGEQTGPGSRPGVMKWKMFTPQAALQCTCTNRMRPAPAPSQGPNYLKTKYTKILRSWDVLDKSAHRNYYGEEPIPFVVDSIERGN